MLTVLEEGGCSLAQLFALSSNVLATPEEERALQCTQELDQVLSPATAALDTAVGLEGTAAMIHAGRPGFSTTHFFCDHCQHPGEQVHGRLSVDLRALEGNTSMTLVPPTLTKTEAYLLWLSGQPKERVAVCLTEVVAESLKL